MPVAVARVVGTVGGRSGRTLVVGKRVDKFSLWRNLGAMRGAQANPATRNRTRDHLIAAAIYSQMLYQLSYSRFQEARSTQTFVYDARSRREWFLCAGARCRNTQRPPNGRASRL